MISLLLRPPLIFPTFIGGEGRQHWSSPPCCGIPMWCQHWATHTARHTPYQVFLSCHLVLKREGLETNREGPCSKCPLPRGPFSWEWLRGWKCQNGFDLLQLVSTLEGSGSLCFGEGSGDIQTESLAQLTLLPGPHSTGPPKAKCTPRAHQPSFCHRVGLGLTVHSQAASEGTEYWGHTDGTPK